MPWKLAPAATMVWAQLRPSHRKKISAALDDLARRPDIDSSPHVGTVRTGEREVKVLRVPGGYRAFFKREPGQIEVVDIASPAQIDFLRPTRESTAA